MRLLFLIAYTCSGVAGLIYQVCWTRVLSLYIGHTTAAASTVVAAFLGGLALGAAAGGARTSRLSARGALVAYAVLELSVAAAALFVPWEIRAFTPLLAWVYADGEPSPLFHAARIAISLAIVFVPALALGATFPMAIRWYAAGPANRAAAGGALYAVNAAGAAAGAILAGFVLIPLIGVSGTTRVGVAASVVAAASGLAILTSKEGINSPAAPCSPRFRSRSVERAARRSDAAGHRGGPPPAGGVEPRWLAALVLGISGFAALVHEIAWTRVLTMVLGPTTYAFAATVTSVIVGIAVGAGVGTWSLPRTRRPALALAIVLALAAATGMVTSSLAGGLVPRGLAQELANAPNAFETLLWRGGLLTAAMIVPTAALLGAAFPFALAMIDDRSRPAAGAFASVYAANTVGSVLGSLAAGFVLIPALGLEVTLRIVAVCLVIAAVIVVSQASLDRVGRMTGAVVSAGALLAMFVSAPWDRELLASGVYLYAPFVPKGLPLEPLLKAGTLLYYREGASATVSVKRLTGTTTLAVDGKVDASNRGDMLTQKLVAHLPLLLHPNPREIAIVGLGSGVTVGAALTHPIARADVIEISPEVVEASSLFITENRNALADARTNLLVADGRSHLLLSKRTYDAIISEPSNPWIAGVSALFTREFFVTARDRLAPGGVMCQWANAYNISDHDLRSIVATFQSVFPHGTAWLVGADDVVLIASDGPLDSRLQDISRHWGRAGVAEDLATVGAAEPFALLSLYVAGPADLARYAGAAPPLADDTMTLEFSGPRELGAHAAGEHGAALKALLADDEGPAIVREALAPADGERWNRRGRMMFQRDAFSDAYHDYQRALRLDPSHAEALSGLVRTAVLTRRGAEALGVVDGLMQAAGSTTGLLAARSKLLASLGKPDEALAAAERAAAGGSREGLEQVASLFADREDVAQLDAAVARLRAVMPAQAAAHYYAGVLALLRGEAADTVMHGRAAAAADPAYAAAYDLIGAAQVRLGRHRDARDAFLTSLRYDTHDSTAYANLGVLALHDGDAAAAADYFAEALWLDPESPLAREGLSRVTDGS